MVTLRVTATGTRLVFLLSLSANFLFLNIEAMQQKSLCSPSLELMLVRFSWLLIIIMMPTALKLWLGPIFPISPIGHFAVSH